MTPLPNYLHNKFYKEFKGSNIVESKVSILKLSHWIDERLSEAHNPIALIINSEEKQKKELEKSSSKHKDSNPVHSFQEENKDDKTNQENFKIICWLYTENHKISKCETLKIEPTINCCNLVKQKKKIPLNCLSNTHMINICKSKKHCQVDNWPKRHHTLLHSKKMSVRNSADHIDSNINRVIEIKILSQTYLHIIHVTLTNSRRDIEVHTNALLDTGWDTSLIRNDIAEKLKFNQKKKDNKYFKCRNKYKKDIIRSSKLYNNTTD